MHKRSLNVSATYESRRNVFLDFLVVDIRDRRRDPALRNVGEPEVLGKVFG